MEIDEARSEAYREWARVSYEEAPTPMEAWVDGYVAARTRVSPQGEPVAERPEWVRLADLWTLPVIPNLRWLVPLCLDTDLALPIRVGDASDPNLDGATARSRAGEGGA